MARVSISAATLSEIFIQVA